ncbi:reverse transcriptase domain-containing protein [[Clostridium] fimetarium]|uniref:Reverse transcriptase (RNA-dependent DNA polymerase) n=1 Tax=[Clostridium] fimetarium TaxID=99656 RepID=A0A1I0M3V8_9FIRM|nr:reverse transcriptase domain-containing protein [[Clostridium] fimetarium]SEV83135.1 Reverse transcriptase (RNA-dependent DNA polymerase) [[Clostridium] fimetarium]
MFDSLDNVRYMVEGSYKKLKSYYYYDKTLLYIKMKIVEFETDGKFKDNLEMLAKNVFEDNRQYFDELENQIKICVMPKTFKSINNDIRLIRGNIDKNKKICKVNFTIDIPVELLILDLMWTLFIKKIYTEQYGEFTYSHAGQFKKGLFNAEKDLISGIDFKSNRCFEPYFQCYTRWRNKALDAAMETGKEENTAMISLDLKSFYYNIDFDFREFAKLFDNDERYTSIEFLTSVISDIYTKYTELVVKYKKGIKKSIGKTVFPIGLISPLILRDIALEGVDNSIETGLSPKYYGRYVDDMLIVVGTGQIEHISVEEIIENILVKKQILNAKNTNGEYNFFAEPSVKLQGEKVNCFYFEKGKENILLDVYCKKIKKNSSEANLLPDIDVLRDSFNSRAYTMNSSDDSMKIRNLEFMESDNYNATLFINGLKGILKNASYDKKYIEKYLTDIINFYSGSQAIEFSNTWRTIFELLFLCKDKDRASTFYFNVKKEIGNLSFDYVEEDEIYSKKKQPILNKLKCSLLLKLDISIGLAVALDYYRGNIKKHKILGQKIRQANMLSHNMVSFPLINYSMDDSINEIPLINMNLNKILSDVTIRKKLFKLDEEKIRWSPRFIHLNELYFCVFYFTIGSGNKFVREDNNSIFKSYIRMNNLSEKIPNPIIYDVENFSAELNIARKDIVISDNCDKRNTKVGLVNTKINEDEVFDILLYPEKGITVEKKQSLYKLLNTAKEEKVKYLVFPEFYMPALWLSDIGGFTKQYGITVVTGLQYIACNDRVFNIVCVIASTCGKTYFKNMIPLFREKNYYAPEERMELAALGYVSKNPSKATYYMVNNGKEKFSTILCFEFTDIASRLIMKGEVDFLCVPQLNRDTNYFSSIVESAARDLHTLVVQANTSKYGDSRVTGPYKTDFKDILKIKGGENDILIVGELEVKALQKFKNSYYSDFEKQVKKCLACKKVRTVSHLSQKCIKCLDKKGKIKGLPPNWK